MKTIDFSQNGSGFYVQIGHSRERLNYEEASYLLAMLLTNLPGVPNPVRNAWDLSIKPRFRTLVMFKAVDGEIITAGYRAEVLIANKTLSTHGPATEIQWLYNEITELYGDSIDYIGESEDMISHKLAENEANDQLIARVCQELGVDRIELERMLVAGEI